VEHEPTLNDEGYKRAGWLKWQLEQQFGKRLGIKKHSDYAATACPGTIDIARIEAECDKFRKGEPMINDVDNEYWRWAKAAKQIRGRDLSREEFRVAAVGKTWLQAIEILSDSTEADANVDYSQWGRIAKNDGWDKQIHALSEQLTATQEALKNEQNKPPKEVIKEVTQIVEKPVEVKVEVPVYTHDAETKQNVNAILKVVKTIQGMVANLFRKK
jgi:hypothetical protein